ncbi:MAG: hypothetical protein ACRD63_04285, partial [Pyrinomonadaceae bacterium]
IGTDRLLVSWPLDSRRVRERLQTGAKRQASLDKLEHIVPLLRVGANDVPQRNESAEVLGYEYLSIEIPADINALQRASPALVAMWREETRSAFTEVIGSGYLVEEFYRLPGNGRPVGLYLLSYRKRIEDFV